MRKLILLFILSILFIGCEGNNQPNGCIVIFDFIKKDLNYPEEAKHHFLDCRSELNSDGTYTVFTFVTAKNGFGVKEKYIFKYVLSHNGLNPNDLNNWSVISKRSELTK